MPRPKAIERAERDVAGGDLGAARRRLASLLVSNGYDPEVAARLGRLCLKMGDREEGGRYLLLSTETGEDIEEAITSFVRLHGSDPRQILRQLPRCARGTFDSLPAAVQQRLHALGVDEADRAEAIQMAAAQRRGRMALAGCLAAGILLLGLLVAAGIVSMTSWLSR